MGGSADRGRERGGEGNWTGDLERGSERFLFFFFARGVDWRYSNVEIGRRSERSENAREREREREREGLGTFWANDERLKREVRLVSVRRVGMGARVTENEYNVKTYILQGTRDFRTSVETNDHESGSAHE